MFRTLLVNFNRIMTPKEKDWFFFQKEGKIFFTIEDPQYFFFSTGLFGCNKNRAPQYAFQLFEYFSLHTFFFHTVLDLVFPLYLSGGSAWTKFMSATIKEKRCTWTRTRCTCIWRKETKNFQIIFWYLWQYTKPHRKHWGAIYDTHLR